MNEVIIAIIGSGALSTVISALIARVDKKRQRDEDIMLLLYHDIKAEAREYLQMGSIDSDGLEVLIKMHKRYHDKGGNGYLDKLMAEVGKLPIHD